MIAGADEYTLLLPIDNAEVFAAKLELTGQPLVSWQAYRLKQGESLPQVAGRYGMSVETLMSVNGIGPRARVPVGHTLLVPFLTESHMDASEFRPDEPLVVDQIRRALVALDPSQPQAS